MEASKTKAENFLPSWAVPSTSELEELTALNGVNWCEHLENSTRSVNSIARALNTALCSIYQTEENF